MKKIGIALAVAVALAIGLGAGYRFAQRGAQQTTAAAEPAKKLYHCPMHPNVISDHPGTCPICGMTLVPSAAAAERPAASAQAVEGRSDVSLSDRGRRLIGAQTEVVGETPVVRSIRVVGQVAYDETRMFHVHTKIQGWIEHVFAGAAGDMVRRGDPLLEIYSPDLLASQQEYLVALDNRARVAGATLPGVRDNAQSLVDAARKRLTLQDLTDDQIDDLVRTRQAQKTVILYSPLTGTITARNVSHGERIESETSLLDIADLSTVWVIGSVYESDLPFVKVGQAADITLSYLPGRSFRGRIALVSPIVDPTTRTVPVRVELENAGILLKPGMFADVQLSSDLGRRLTVPKDAVMRTGERDLVFVSPSDGIFQPREVTLGLALPDRYEVTAGLTVGERVLSAAGFFVDSESRLKSALGSAAEPAP